jgi:hypothetical protein
MADIKISQLTSAAALTGAEEVPVVQGASTVRTTAQDIADLAPGLGYTAENVANKATSTSLGTSNTLYPSQNAVKVYVDGSVVGLLDDRGNYTPGVSSPGAYPSTGGSGTAGAILKGDLWFMDASGYLGTTAVVAGATVRALVNTPGQTGANWNILSAGAISVPNSIQTLKVSLTSANILALNGTPFTLIAAQGAGTLTSVLKVWYKYNFVTTAYTGGGFINVKTLAGLFITSNLSILDSTEDTIGVPVTGVSTVSNYGFENSPIVLTSTVNQTLGDSTLDVYLTYEVITL